MATNLDNEPGAGGGPSAPMVTTYTPSTSGADSLIRKWVSYWLLALLAAVIVAAFIQLFIINGHYPSTADTNNLLADDQADSDRLMGLMNVVFGPIVTLFSSVVGFYFGARTAREGASGGGEG